MSTETETVTRQQGNRPQDHSGNHSSTSEQPHPRLSLRHAVQRRLSKGAVAAIRTLRLEWEIMRRHRRGVSAVRALSFERPRKLHLGCGHNVKQGWLNVDLFASEADVQLDLREPWPFPNGVFSHIYSEHVFEHFSIHTEVPHVLAEVRRTLVPGGVFDAGVPDTTMALRGYGNPADEYWRLAKSVWHPAWCETQLDHINYHFRQDGEHLWAWDEDSLSHVLRRAGFVDIGSRAFDPSLDLESRRLGTLYMRARTPQAAR